MFGSVRIVFWFTHFHYISYAAIVAALRLDFLVGPMHTHCTDLLDTVHYAASYSDSRYPSSTVPNLSTDYPLNINIVYTPETDKNIIV